MQKKTVSLGGGNVPILDPIDDEVDEEVAVEGIPVSIPHSFGGDGNEHRMATPVVSAHGNITMPKH